MYSEKATKIWQNHQTCLNAATKIQIKIGDFIKFISFIRIYELYMIEKLLEAQALIMLLQKWFPPIMNPSHVFWSISRHVRCLDTLSLTYIDLVRLLFFLFLFQDLSTILILIRTRLLQGVSMYTLCFISLQYLIW